MSMNARLCIGDTVKHFKRETLPENERGTKYLYIIKDIAKHTETGEMLVIYEALYPDENGVVMTWARPHDEFVGEVDKTKYPNIKQHYRFEKIL